MIRVSSFVVAKCRPDSAMRDLCGTGLMALLTDREPFIRLSFFVIGLAGRDVPVVEACITVVDVNVVRSDCHCDAVLHAGINNAA